MSHTLERGFSVARFFLFFGLIILLLGGGIFAFYVFNKQNSINESEIFTKSIIQNIETGDTTSVFNSFSSSAKGTDESSAYYTWYFWASSFKENSITISDSAKSIKYENPSFLGLVSEASKVTFTYSTNKDSEVYFTVVKSGSEWKVDTYGTAS